VAKVAVSDQKK